MKQNINIGAYGWRHSHWLNDFYPDDLPVAGEEDWRLAYYSNEFNTVLVPADYWHSQSEQAQAVDCECWLDDVNDEFQFFVECHGGMFEHVSSDEMIKQLEILQPQLSALVFLEGKQPMPESLQNQFYDLAESLEINIFADNGIDLQAKKIWRQKKQHHSDLALLDDDLTDLRSVRTIIDDFVSQTANIEPKGTEATIIVDHPSLRAQDLSQFRAVLDIMGH